MIASKIIREIMTKQKITQEKLGRRLRCTKYVIYRRLARGNLSLDVVISMLTVLDYELVIQPSGKPIDKNAYRVDPSYLSGIPEEGETK
jgi:transcriptional regulator with XRE-family HTH domain